MNSAKTSERSISLKEDNRTSQRSDEMLLKHHSLPHMRGNSPALRSFLHGIVSTGTERGNVSDHFLV